MSKNTSFRFLVVGLFALVPYLAQAATNIDAVTYRNWARESNSKAFLSELDLGAAKLAYQRARFVYDMHAKLVQTNSTSYFEFSDAIVRLLKAQFEVKRAEAALFEAQTEEKIWKLRSDWSQKEQAPNVKEVARQYAEIRKKHFELAEELVKGSQSLAEQLNYKFTQMTELFKKKSVSADEYNQIKLAHEGAKELLEAAKQRLPLSKKLWEEASAEVID